MVSMRFCNYVITLLGLLLGGVIMQASVRLLYPANLPVLPGSGSHFTAGRW